MTELGFDKDIWTVIKTIFYLFKKLEESGMIIDMKRLERYKRAQMKLLET